MKKTVNSLTIIFLLVASYAQALDTIKVLFIGNSFTSVNDLPNEFSQLALGANKPVVVASYAPGGISVGDISQGTSAHMNNPIVFDLIRSNNWNYLVLQDNQGRFVNTYGVFPSASEVIQGHIKIRDSLLYYHPCAKMIWFAGWGPKTGYLPYASTGSGLIDRIYNNYRYLLTTALQVIAPIGPAWQRIMTNDSTINLWGPDEVHPSLYGTCLTADVVYASIFKSSAIKSAYVANGVSIAQDSLLKNTAFQTVLDSLNVTGLNTITPTIVQQANTLVLAGYNNCNWFLNNTFLATTQTLTITQAGDYTAIAYNQNNCEFITLVYTVSVVNSINATSYLDAQISVYPNPFNSGFTINLTKTCKEIIISDMLGNMVISKPTNNQSSIYIENLNSGSYILTIVDDSNNRIIRKISSTR